VIVFGGRLRLRGGGKETDVAKKSGGLHEVLPPREKPARQLNRGNLVFSPNLEFSSTLLVAGSRFFL